MADRYWVNGTGSWDNSVGAKWASTSGGAGGQSVPLSTDNVFFDANSGTAPYTVTVGATNKPCANLSFAGFTGTFVEPVSFNTTIYGGVILPDSTGTITGSGTWTFVGTGGFLITPNNYIFPFNFIFNSAGGDWLITDALNMTGGIVLTAGVIRSNYAVTISSISTSGSGVRTFSVPNLYLTGSGTLIAATTTTSLVWSTNSIYVTGSQTLARTLTFNTVVYPGNGYCELGGTGAGAITLAVATTGDPRVYVTNTGGAVVSFSTGNMAELIFSGGTNVVWTNAATQTLTIEGDLTLVSTMGTPTLTPSFAFRGSGYALANNSRITLAGKSLATGTVTLNDILGPGAGSGTFTFVDAFSSNAAVTVTSAGAANINGALSCTTFTQTTGTVTANAGITTTTGSLILTAGTLNLGSSTHNLFSFNSSNSGTRTINFGTSTVNVTGNNATVWTTSTITGLTVSGTSPTVNLTYSGSVGTRTITVGLLTEANAINVNVTNGSDIANISSANFKSLNFTGFSGSTTIASSIFYKDLTLSPTQTLTTVGSLTFAGTSVTQTITSNNLTIPTATITINSATTTVQYVGTLTTTGALLISTGTLNINANLTIGTASAFTFTAGTINANNGANINCGTFSSAVGNTRTLNMGSGTWTLTSTGSVWNVLATSLTFSAEQSRIVMTNTSATACTFAGGGLTYYTVELAKGSSTAITTISGSNTFANFIDNTSTAAHTITFLTSTTQSFYKFNVRGSTGGLITINRSAAPTPILTKLGRGIVCYCDYITLGTLTGTPASTWYIGANSSIGLSTGFIATAALSSQSLLGAGGVG